MSAIDSGFYIPSEKLTKMTTAEFTREYEQGREKFFTLNLQGIDLQGVELSNIIFEECDLTGANFSDCDIRKAQFSDSYLREANFRHAELMEVHFSSCNLSGTDFQSSCLWIIRFAYINASDGTCGFEGANLDFATLSDVVFTKSQLEPFCRAKQLTHIDMSVVDERSIQHSLRSLGLKAFLQDIGYSKITTDYLIDSAKSLDPLMKFSLMHSVFISYGGPDERFARKLRNELHAAGVHTYLFSLDAVAGQKTHRLMRNGIKQHDRMILICSEESLQRSGVLNEIEEVRMREAREGGTSRIIPITLDSYIFDQFIEDKHEVAEYLTDRVVADFTQVQSDEKEFHIQVSRLLKALRKSHPDN